MDLLEWVKIAALVVTLIVSTLLTVSAYFAKKVIDQYGEELKSAQRDRAELEKDFLKFQAHLPRVFEYKDDHIRDITIVEHKIDDLGNTVMRGMADLGSDIKMLLRELPKRRGDGTG